MSHRNARTTYLGRLLIIGRYRDGWPKAHIASAMGISRKCVSTWVTRYETEGEAGLHDRCSRPHTMPTRTAAEVEARIVALRTRERRGPDWLAAELGVSARTISRVLRRHQVPHLADCDPLTGQVIRASKTTAVRYERRRPGELVHMDARKARSDPRRRRLAGSRSTQPAPQPHDEGGLRLCALVRRRSLPACVLGDPPGRKGSHLCRFPDPRSTTSPATASPGSNG